MTSNISHLQDLSIALYEKYIAYVSENTEMMDKKTLAMLLVEQGNCYINFYKYKQAKKCIKQALKLLDLNIKLTGRLGKRTKYQLNDVT